MYCRVKFHHLVIFVAIWVLALVLYTYNAKEGNQKPLDDVHDVPQSSVFPGDVKPLIIKAYAPKQSKTRHGSGKGRDLLRPRDLKRSKVTINSHDSPYIHFIAIGVEKLPFVASCAVESAARIHPDKMVIVWTNTGEFKSEAQLGGISNIRVAKLNTKELFSANKGWLSHLENKSPKWRGMKSTRKIMANVLRIAILLHHGGTYIDWDQILLRPLKEIHSSMSSISSELIGNGVMVNFLKNDTFLLDVFSHMATDYSMKAGWSGSHMISKVYLTGHYPHVKILPRRAFYPVSREEQGLLSEDSGLEDMAEKSITLNLWHNLKSKKTRKEN